MYRISLIYKDKAENSDVKVIKISDNIEFTEPIELNRDIQIDGDNHKFTYNLEDYYEGRFFINEEKNAKINLKNIEFIGIDGQKDGSQAGGIESRADLTIENCRFKHNGANYGAAIINNNKLTLKGINLFEDNIAERGGAIASFPEELLSESLKLKRRSGIDNLEKGISREIEPSIKVVGGKTVFKNNFAYAEGGAIFNNKLEIKDSASVEFENNISYYGGAIFSNEYNNYLPIIDVSNDSQVKFKIDDSVKNVIKDPEGLGRIDLETMLNEGLFIFATNSENINIQNASFINDLSDKESVDTSSEICIEINREDLRREESPKQMDIKNSYIKSDKSLTESFLKLDYSYVHSGEAYSADFDKNKFEGIENVFSFDGPSRKVNRSEEVSSNSMENLSENQKNISELNIKNSSFINNNDFNIINSIERYEEIRNYKKASSEEEIEERASLNFVNNTVKASDFRKINSNSTKFPTNELISNVDHNAFILDKISEESLVDENSSGKNNIFFANDESKFLQSLGEGEKINDSNKEILFEKKGEDSNINKNIYIGSSNKRDLDKTLKNKIESYDNVGYKDELGKIEHYKPVKDSYANGFDKIEGIDKDAIDTERKDKVTMGPIEWVKDTDPEGGGSGGGGGSETKNYVILASGDKYTDVLTATVLGNEKKCPILLTDKNKVSDNTLKEIDRLNADKIIISGGPQSVSEKVVEQLENEGHDVRRIAGQNRYETARKIGQEVRLTTKNMDEAVLVDGTNFPDVITMSTLANEKRVPILLTEPKSLNKITEDTLKDWSIDELTIGGEKRSVSQNVEDQVKSKVESVDRIGGHDRYETAYKVADNLREKTNNKKDMILVDGTDFPDGITISSLAAKFRSPILLTTPSNLHPMTAKAMNDWTIENILIGGGYNSVSKSIEDNLNIKNKERVAGSNRYNTAVEISKRYTNNTDLGRK